MRPATRGASERPCSLYLYIGTYIGAATSRNDQAFGWAAGKRSQTRTGLDHIRLKSELWLTKSAISVAAHLLFSAANKIPTNLYAEHQ